MRSGESCAGGYLYELNYYAGHDRIDVECHKADIAIYQLHKRYRVDVVKLAAWAKAGCPDWGKTEGNVEYEAVLAEWGWVRGWVAENIRSLFRQRDSLVAERDRLKARVAELERAKEPKPQAEMRCVDCEHLACGTVKDTWGLCAVRGGTRYIYGFRICYAFYPVAAGCGNAEQALRQELIRLEDNKKECC